MPADAGPDYLDYLEPFDGLCRIHVECADFEVPVNNTVLRVLQHLELTTGAFELLYKDFCWNADCHNCMFAYAVEGEVREALGCQHRVSQDLCIVRLPRSVFRGNAFPREAATASQPQPTAAPCSPP